MPVATDTIISIAERTVICKIIVKKGGTYLYLSSSSRTVQCTDKSSNLLKDLML